MSLPNIIFLDFDGVICNPRACLAVRNNGMYSYLDPIACLLVKRLCEDNNAKLVISSSWRIIHDREGIKGILSAACPGLGEYVWDSATWWKTTSAVFQNDVHGGCGRGMEIKHWIDNHYAEFQHFVILDDDSDMEPLMESFVKTDAYDGISFMNFLQAEKILQGSVFDVRLLYNEE